MPRFADSGSVLLAASIMGATVMPHAIYAHSALTRDRFGKVEEGSERRRVLRATRIDVTIALAIAGTVNVVILLLAAATLQGVEGTNTLEGAHAAIGAALGPVVATLFAVGLLASGLASTSVGAYAGAEIMQGLLHVRIPLLVRRIVTLIPALIILVIGFDPTLALVLSQVVLSFGIPFALIPLVRLTSLKSLLGESANRWWTTVLAARRGRAADRAERDAARAGADGQLSRGPRGATAETTRTLRRHVARNQGRADVPSDAARIQQRRAVTSRQRRA